MTARTLRAIRKDAPASDLEATALSPARPEWAQARDGSRYVRVSIFPETRDELHQLSREYGAAVVRNLDWSCVIRWLMDAPDAASLSNPLGLALKAVSVCRANDAVRLGLPHYEGKAWPAPKLGQVSHETGAQFERVAEEALADWRKAGSPHLDQQRLKRSYQYLVSCPAFAKYVRPSPNGG